jgi:hypothetical protein
MSARAKFVYFVLALILAFTGLATATFSAVHAGDLAGWSEVESAAFDSGTASQSGQMIAEDCSSGGGSTTCP